jgi:dolichyl-phosphate beta-glucosyltransferase
VGEAVQAPFLSIIIPAYNEELRLPLTLQRTVAFLRQQAYRAEVLVVENGSTDQTSLVVEQFVRDNLWPDDPFQIHLLHSGQGKGAAVKQGMMAAKGEYLIMSDADLAVPIEDINDFLPPKLPAHSFDVAIASREVAGAKRNGEPAYRHLMGRVFNLLVRLMAVPGVQDTQCGFKCFTREAARWVFPLQRIDGWGFDVEILYIAVCHHLRMVEVPANWFYGQNSRIRPIESTISMVKELLLIRQNGRLGYYDKRQATSMADKLPVT